MKSKKKMETNKIKKLSKIPVKTKVRIFFNTIFFKFVHIEVHFFYHIWVLWQTVKTQMKCHKMLHIPLRV